VRQWLKVHYPAIRQKAKKQRGRIFWLDELGLRSQHQTGTTYAPRGKTPVVQRTGKRFSLHMISAISGTGQLVFMVVDSRFNGAVFLQFLQKLIKSTKHKVFLIADSHPVHTGKKVLQWVEGHKSSMELFYLPLYSPELNPDEYFNQDVKSNAVAKARPRNKEQLKLRVNAFTKKKKSNPQMVKKYFHPNPVAYACMVP
jgi:transposase